MATNEELLDQIVRLLALQIRLSVGNQTEAIIEMGKTGLSSSRIAELVGTTAATAKTTLQRAKKPRITKKTGKGVRNES
jgi:DNA-directed RNA polymerase specialized sigma24 family protein